MTRVRPCRITAVRDLSYAAMGTVTGSVEYPNDGSPSCR